MRATNELTNQPTSQETYVVTAHFTSYVFCVV